MSSSRQSPRNLMDLPPELHSVILSKFSNSPPYSYVTPSNCTVETATWLLPQLSNDLLNAAKVSPRLAKAAISALGSRVTIVSNRSTSRLAEWIPILRCKIKALSLTGSLDIGFCRGECEQEVCECNHLYDDTIRTLKALYTTEVKLEALNLEDLILIKDEKSAEIEDCMTRAIQKTGPSLKEIALNANLVSARALKCVTLPKLEVAQMTFEDFNDKEFERMERRSSAETYCEMLEALNGHANRIENKSSLKELRLYGVRESPDVDREACRSLFVAVEKLILMCEESSNIASLAEFIANFKNLRTLHWFIGAATANDMNKIFQGCIYLDEIVLDLGTSGLFYEIGAALDSDLFRDLFVSFRGKLRSLQLCSYLTSEQLKVLGQNCPNLASLTTDIGPANLGGFHALLETHCRLLRELRLSYTTKTQDSLGSDGWMAFSQAICSASDHLSVISLVGNRNSRAAEHAITDMIEAITRILEFMTGRAKTVVFQVPTESHDLKVILTALKYVLHAAMTHCNALDYLCLDFLQEHPGSIAVNDAEACDLFHEVINLCKQLEFSGSGRDVELGCIHELLENPYKVEGTDGGNLEDIWGGLDGPESVNGHGEQEEGNEPYDAMGQ